MTPDPYLTMPEAATVLRYRSTKSVLRLARKDPTFPVTKLGPARNAPLLIHRERLEKWLRANTQGSSKHVDVGPIPPPNGALRAPSRPCADPCAEKGR